jgi:hypothetical protein
VYISLQAFATNPHVTRGKWKNDKNHNDNNNDNNSCFKKVLDEAAQEKQFVLFVALLVKNYSCDTLAPLVTTILVSTCGKSIYYSR